MCIWMGNPHWRLHGEGQEVKEKNTFFQKKKRKERHDEKKKREDKSKSFPQKSTTVEQTALGN